MAKKKKHNDNRKAAPEAALEKGSKTMDKTVESWMTQGKNQFDRFSQDAAAQGKEGFEALVRSGNIWAKGMEDMMKTYVSLAQTTAEKNAQGLKALLASRTLNEFTETQNRVCQQNLDDFLSGVTQLSELGARLATETLEPLNEQVGKTIRKASDSLQEAA